MNINHPVLVEAAFRAKEDNVIPFKKVKDMKSKPKPKPPAKPGKGGKGC